MSSVFAYITEAHIFIFLFFMMLGIQLFFAWTFKKRKQENFSSEASRLKKSFLVNFARRLKVAWVLYFILVVSFALGKVGVALLFTLISFLALREFISLIGLRASDYWAMFASFYVFIPLQYFLAATNAQFLFFIFIPVYVFLMAPLLFIINQDEKRFFERAATFQWALIACVYCLSYAPAIAGLSLKSGTFQSTSLLLFLLLTIFISDALQYVFGNIFGRRLIAPKLSPNKTVEGTLYGIFGAVVIGTALFPLTPFKPWQASLICLAITVVGFLGGLVMSGIKRSLKIKDWGDILSAHGGVLDRLDSFVFTAPLFYHICRYYFN